MRAINKGHGPASLTEHREAQFNDYNNYANKDDLRQALVTEQRGLCCYCMGRIYPNIQSMKIEHWHCQSRYPDEQLNYLNLLGACLGGIGGRRESQHCDTRKGDVDIMWNPADPARNIEARITYEYRGHIRSNEAIFDRQINDVLNLNLPVLRQHRRVLIDTITRWWKREKARGNGRVPRNRINRKRNQILNGNGVLGAYCQVAVWWLDQKIARIEA